MLDFFIQIIISAKNSSYKKQQLLNDFLALIRDQFQGSNYYCSVLQKYNKIGIKNAEKNRHDLCKTQFLTQHHDMQQNIDNMTIKCSTEKLNASSFYFIKEKFPPRNKINFHSTNKLTIFSRD